MTTAQMGSIADLPLAERHAIVRRWLDDLTTIYEQAAAERDAQKESASYLAGKLVEVDRERLRLETMIERALASYQAGELARTVLLELTAEYQVHQRRQEWPAQRLDDAARVTEEP